MTNLRKLNTALAGLRAQGWLPTANAPNGEFDGLVFDDDGDVVVARCQRVGVNIWTGSWAGTDWRPVRPLLWHPSNV